MTKVNLIDAPNLAIGDRAVALASLKPVPDVPLLPIFADALYAMIPGATVPAPAGLQVDNGTARLHDALGRLTWKNVDGSIAHYGVQTDAGGAFQLPALVTGSDGINGKTAMYCGNVRSGVYHVQPTYSGPSQIFNLAQLDRHLTPEALEIVVFSGPSGQTGRVFGQAPDRNGNEADIADAGSGFGFLSSANGGKMLFQSRADSGETSSANRIVFSRTLGDWAPTLALVRSRMVNGRFAGEVIIISNGNRTVHPFSFDSPPANSGGIPWVFTGVLSNTGKPPEAQTNQRKISYRSRINHYASDLELARVEDWMTKNYGPF